MLCEGPVAQDLTPVLGSREGIKYPVLLAFCLRLAITSILPATAVPPFDKSPDSRTSLQSTDRKPAVNEVRPDREVKWSFDSTAHKQFIRLLSRVRCGTLAECAADIRHSRVCVMEKWKKSIQSNDKRLVFV